MNTKKYFVAALAAAVSVSAAAVSVSAIAPGVTNDTAKQTVVVEPGKVTHFSVTINDVTIDADVPADAIAAGEELTFGASTITNVDIEAAVAELPDVATSELLDVYFLDADGDTVSFAGVGVDVVITPYQAEAYDTVYIYEDGTGLNKLADNSNNAMSFKAPHFSYYVLVRNGIEEPVSNPGDVTSNINNDNSNTNNNNNNTNNNTTNNTTNNTGVNTGDTATTAAVFGIVGAAALGTALVASKSKKHAK